MTEPTRPTARAVALAGARVAGTLVAVGVAVVVVGAATVLPIPTVAPTPASTLVAPVATPQSLACPGGFLRLGDAQGQDATTASSVGAPTTASVGDPTTVALSGPAAGSGLTGAADTDVSGAQLQALAAPDVSGLAAATCAPATSSAWLVGGSTSVGRTTLVVLSNPSDVSATVDLELWGEQGPVTASGATGIVVDAGSQTVIALSGLAPNLASPVVHVQSTGGLIVATLQETIVRGLETAGADVVGATADPSPDVIIPGITVRAAVNVENRIATDGSGASADLDGVLRVIAPGTADAHLTIDVAPVGAGEGTSYTATAAAGVVSDIPLGVTDDGEYTVTVTSDEPIVAAARVSTASTPDPASNTSDVGWVVAPPRLASASSITVVNGPSPTLHLANPGAAAIDVTVDDATVSLAAGASESQPIAPGGHTISATGAVVASIGYAGDGQLAGYSVEPRAADADPLLVFP